MAALTRVASRINNAPAEPLDLDESATSIRASIGIATSNDGEAPADRR